MGMHVAIVIMAVTKKMGILLGKTDLGKWEGTLNHDLSRLTRLCSRGSLMTKRVPLPGVESTYIMPL